MAIRISEAFKDDVAGEEMLGWAWKSASPAHAMGLAASLQPGTKPYFSS